MYVGIGRGMQTRISCKIQTGEGFHSTESVSRRMRFVTPAKLEIAEGFELPEKLTLYEIFINA